MRASLLRVGLRLRAAPPGALRRLSFLGGVLHGAVAAQWHARHGSGAACMPINASLRWRLLAPAARLPSSDAAHQPWVDAEGWLRFGLLVHADGGPPLLAKACAELAAIPEITCGAERYRVVAVACTPHAVTAGLHLGADKPRWGQRLRLDWTTPLHLASRAQALAGHGDAAPTLLRCVRSVARRIRALEPDWAHACGLDSPGWLQTEEALRNALALGGDGPPTQALDWRYGSRTKAAPFMQRGLLGTQCFSAALPPSLLAVLAAGAWLGAGEGGSFGCGQYRWQAWDADGLPLAPLLPQPEG